MKNRSFLKRLGFAVSGLHEGWRRERSFRAQILIGVLVVIGILVLGASTAWMGVGAWMRHAAQWDL